MKIKLSCKIEIEKDDKKRKYKVRLCRREIQKRKWFKGLSQIEKI